MANGVTLNFGRSEKKQPEPDPMDRLVRQAQERALDKGLENLEAPELQMVLHAWSARTIIDGLDAKARKRQSHVLVRWSPYGLLMAAIWLANILA